MNPQRILDSFFEMARIESPTFHEGVMAQYCAQRLRELGFSVRIDDSAQKTGSDTGNVIAHLVGTTAGHIAFSAHMDTVTPCEGIDPHIVVEDVDGAGQPCEVIRSAGNTILSADDKAGIAAILEALACVIEEGRPRPAITVVLTTGEERGLLGASALPADVFDPAQETPCFVLDADGAPGTIVTAAPFHYLLNARIEGRAAHAGVAPEEGISAIQIVAHAIASMPLGRIDECTTANIGTLNGGSAMNVVPAECTLVGECRSLHEDRVEAQRAAMTRALKEAADRFGGAARIEWTLDYPAIMLPEDAPIVERLKAAMAAAGLEPRLTATGGGADANVLVTKGANAVTLGIGMANFHTCDEYIKVRDLQDSARLVEAIIAEYART